MNTLKSSKVSRVRAYVAQMLGPANAGKVFYATEDDQIQVSCQEKERTLYKCLGQQMLVRSSA